MYVTVCVCTTYVRIPPQICSVCLYTLPLHMYVQYIHIILCTLVCKYTYTHNMHAHTHTHTHTHTNCTHYTVCGSRAIQLLLLSPLPTFPPSHPHTLTPSPRYSMAPLTLSLAAQVEVSHHCMPHTTHLIHR